MDEPTNGLDIPGKSQFRKLLIREMNESCGIVISTHQVQDVEQLLDHVVILDDARVLLDASVTEICHKLYFTQTDNESETSEAYYALLLQRAQRHAPESGKQGFGNQLGVTFQRHSGTPGNHLPLV